ncbi:MAG: hypothetical protein K2O77_09520 [Limosilactobacillus sp.]|nr:MULTISPECIES: hypothetical protein [Limosilactobacillus]MCD7136711.1 hypothetical protein [Limosilactobacillus balticus]MDE7041146.1 hypothetical protein [Limosilactobacillus sp.]
MTSLINNPENKKQNLKKVALHVDNIARTVEFVSDMPEVNEMIVRTIK